jgi:hypothetical protein
MKRLFTLTNGAAARSPRCSTNPWRGRRGSIIRSVSALSLLVTLSAYAAKGDKPANPDKRIEKIERKLERAGVAEISAAIAQRQAMGATAPAPAPESDRSRSDRERSSSGSSSSRSRSERGEYREPTTPADSKYDSFRVIVEKNIFNPNRVGRTRERTEERPPRVDTIALVGTMQSDKGVVAFFDSPDAAFRKTLREGQSVGEFKVQKIQANEVELLQGEKPVSLRVAQQLRRPEGGEWSVSNAEPRVEGASAGPATAAPSEPMAIPADASDAVKRLMEARNKQLKQN